MLRRNFLKSIGFGFVSGLFGGLIAKEAVAQVAAPVATQPLKAAWSVEAAADLRAVHNLEAERNLLDVMAKEINAEIDREVLADLRNAIDTFWSVKPRVLIDYHNGGEDEFGIIFRRALKSPDVLQYYVRTANILPDGTLRVVSFVMDTIEGDRAGEPVLEIKDVPSDRWMIECFDAYGNILKELTVKDLV